MTPLERKELCELIAQSRRASHDKKRDATERDRARVCLVMLEALFARFEQIASARRRFRVVA